ncbi:MAG TPA: hypothetical protein VFL28_07015 [bacterium]|nr:hypothetical protein [bacterium]
MDARPTGRTRAAEGWRALRAFFAEGARHLSEAVAAFEEAERLLRRADPETAGPGGETGAADVEGVLIGLSLALRLRRRPEDARRAVVLAQELLNVVRRESGEAAAVPLRAYLEDAYRDLADLTTGAEAGRAAEDGIAACDRTLALAKRFHAGDAVAHARATKSLLLRRLAALRTRPSGDGVRSASAAAEARGLLREADRLAAAALAGWPAGDAEGLAAFRADVATALVEGAHPRSSAVDRAEELLRQAERAAPPENRYLAARIAKARARAALAVGRPEAVDDVAAASAALRDLGLEGEAEEVERWL